MIFTVEVVRNERNVVDMSIFWEEVERDFLQYTVIPAQFPRDCLVRTQYQMNSLRIIHTSPGSLASISVHLKADL